MCDNCVGWGWRISRATHIQPAAPMADAEDKVDDLPF